jgi:glutamine amidotransferase
MCELFALSSKHPCHVQLSLAAFVEQAGNRNSDGWGLANMDGNAAYIYHEPVSPAESMLAQYIARAGVDSTAVLSHVRKRTVGGVCLANTHPFTREWRGMKHVFAFNGDVPSVLGNCDPPRRFQPVGDTDAELIFCILLERLVEAQSVNGDEMDVLHGLGCELARLGPYNFLYACGQRIYAFGGRRRHGGREEPPGLWWVSRHCEEQATDIVVPGVHVSSGTCVDQRVTLVASIPVTKESWQPFPENMLVCLHDGQIVERRMA